MYDMTLMELSETLEYKKKGMAYEFWKQSELIRLAIMESLKDKKSRFVFPNNPQDACPELYPPKPSLKININLNKKYDERS